MATKFSVWLGMVLFPGTNNVLNAANCAAHATQMRIMIRHVAEYLPPAGAGILQQIISHAPAALLGRPASLQDGQTRDLFFVWLPALKLTKRLGMEWTPAFQLFRVDQQFRFVVANSQNA